MKTNDPIANLPGGLLIVEGLADYQAGRCTIPACLVAIAKSRLAGAGLIAGAANGQFSDPERQLSIDYFGRRRGTPIHATTRCCGNSSASSKRWIAE